MKKDKDLSFIKPSQIHRVLKAYGLQFPLCSLIASLYLFCRGFLSKKRLTVGQADSPVAIHSISFQSSGELTAFIDLSLDSDRKQEESQGEESLHVDLEAGSAAG